MSSSLLDNSMGPFVLNLVPLRIAQLSESVSATHMFVSNPSVEPRNL